MSAPVDAPHLCWGGWHPPEHPRFDVAGSALPQQHSATCRCNSCQEGEGASSDLQICLAAMQACKIRAPGLISALQDTGGVNETLWLLDL